MAENTRIYRSEVDKINNENNPPKRIVNRISYNKLTSIGIGCFLYASALMIHFHYLKSTFYISVKATKDDPITFFMWHIGVVSGCAFCGWNRNTWPTRLANFVIGFILIISGSLICLNNFLWRDATYLVGAARFMAGVCFGFVYITTLVHIADNVPKNMRGFMSTSLTIVSLFKGLAMSTSHLIGSNLELPDQIAELADETRYIKIMMAVILITFCLTLKATPEPMTWYLKTGKMDEARTALNHLWHNIIESKDIQYEFDERVKFMSEDYEVPDERFFIRIFTQGNWKPILLMICLRMTSVMVFFIQFLCFDQLWLLYYVVHFIILLVIKHCLDAYGRWWSLFFGVFPGILLIPYLAYNLNAPEKFSPIETINPFFVILLYGIEPAMHTYSSEAFPLSKRNASLAFVTSFEYIFGVTAISSFLLNNNDMLLGAIIVSFIGFLLSIFFIPKTTGLSIRESRDEFNRFYKPNIRINELF